MPGSLHLLPIAAPPVRCRAVDLAGLAVRAAFFFFYLTQTAQEEIPQECILQSFTIIAYYIMRNSLKALKDLFYSKAVKSCKL